MDPKVPSLWASPPSGEASAAWFPKVRPAVHERLVVPEGREEILGGERIVVSPSDPPHARQHTEITFVVRAHAAPGYLVAVDMLTRTDEDSDFAADVSVFSDRLDPTTGGRRLEELVFEVRNTERLGRATEKAKRLAARGVRRIFYVHVLERQVSEWSGKEGGWRGLGADAVLEDPCLLRPLPVRAILDAAAADEAVAAALLARGTRVLTEFGHRERAEGRAEGARRALLRVLGRRGFAVSPEVEARIAKEIDPERLERWHDLAVVAERMDDVFGKA